MAKLGRKSDGALDLIALCEVVSYAMKGSPHTHDTLTLVEPAGRETTVTLADVAAAGLKALYTMHPTFDEQRCWLHTESALASQCIAEGAAVSFAGTHQPSSFLIRARDWVQRPCPSGGELFDVRMRGPVSLQAEVTDRNDGTYMVNFTAAISGTYQMGVTLNRAHISGSPFTLVIDADQTRPEYCVAEGPGLTTAEAGKPASFVIYKRDRNGNPRTRGVDHFYADVQGPGKWECKIKDERDGSYSVTYTAKAAGTYRLDVGLAPNAGPIAHSPFTIIVRPSVPDPRATTLVAPPPQTVLCGRPFTLQLIARDRYGNLCTHPVAEGEQPSAWIAADGSKAREAAQVHMLEPGRYALSLTPVAQGRNMAHVCWAGMNVKGSPFQLKTLPAPPHASSFKLTLKPKTWPTISAGTRFKLRVQAYDRFGNSYTANCPLPKVWLQGTGETAISRLSSDSADGGSGSRSSSPDPIHPSLGVPPLSAGGGAGGLGLSLTPGAGARSSSRSCDAPVLSSPRQVASAETFATRLRSQLISDFGLGAGSKQLPEVWERLIAEADHLTDSTLGGAAALDYTRSTGRESKASTLRLLGAATVDPDMSIEHNLVQGSMPPVARDKLVPNRHRRCLCEVIDASHGVYEVSGLPLHAGTYKLLLQLPPLTPSAADPRGGTRSLESGASVTASRQQQPGSPTLPVSTSDAEAVALVVETEQAQQVAQEEAQGCLCAEVTVVAGAIHPPACTLSGDGLSLGYENEPSYFELVAIDKHGNAAEVGGESFEIRAHRLLPGGQRKLTDIRFEVTDCKDGRYEICYWPNASGRWELSVILVRSMTEIYERITSMDLSDPSEGTPYELPVWNGGRESFATRKPYVGKDSEIQTLVGGRSFMVVVRPTLSKDLSPLEAAAAMEEHARIETAMACEAMATEEERIRGKTVDDPGDGLHWAVAGEKVQFVVRMPPRPLRSPDRKVVRREAHGAEEVMSTGLSPKGKGGGRVGSWSAAEHLVLDQARLAVSGRVEPAPGCEARRMPLEDFVLERIRDNGDGSFLVSYTANVGGALKLSVELAGGGHIGGSPFNVDILPNVLVPENSSVSGRGAHQTEVGVPSSFDLFPRDRCGNARRFNADEVKARIVRAPADRQPGGLTGLERGGGMFGDREACKVELTQGPEGGCRVHYTLLEPGKYLIHAATGAPASDADPEGRFVPVKGCPLELECGAGPVVLSCCTMLEVGLGGEPLARTTSMGGGRLWIQTRDQLANARSTPSSQELWCEVRQPSQDPASGPTILPCACVDLGDGRVEVTYPPNTPVGILEVWIGLVESVGSKKPMPVNRGPGDKHETTTTSLAASEGGPLKPADEHRLGLVRMESAIRFADNSLVTAPGILRVKPGMLFDIIVFSTDDAGRQQQRGGEQLRAQLSSGPAPVALEVYDNGDGSYRVATAVQVSVLVPIAPVEDAQLLESTAHAPGEPTEPTAHAVVAEAAH